MQRYSKSRNYDILEYYSQQITHPCFQSIDINDLITLTCPEIPSRGRARRHQERRAINMIYISASENWADNNGITRFRAVRAFQSPAFGKVDDMVHHFPPFPFVLETDYA